LGPAVPSSAYDHGNEKVTQHWLVNVFFKGIYKRLLQDLPHFTGYEDPLWQIYIIPKLTEI
jgi:hypothetical protein